MQLSLIHSSLGLHLLISVGWRALGKGLNFLASKHNDAGGVHAFLVDCMIHQSSSEKHCRHLQC